MDDLKTIIRRVLTYLRDNANFADPRCPHERALKRAIAYAELSDVEKKWGTIRGRGDRLSP